MSENEYIDREVVRTAIKSLCDKYNVAYGGNSGGYGEDLEKTINNLPAADVVKVVRCKDCILRKAEDCTMCYSCNCGEQHTWETDDDFCSYGERKEIK